ncbi:MAG: cohesin domain-containing protein, partial [Anaerolineales bacterium]
MKPKIGLKLANVFIAVILLFTGMMNDATLVSAQTGTVTAEAIPSDASLNVGEQVTVSINIDLTGVDAPDNSLGGFTSTLAWDPDILSYNSNSGLQEGFTGAINTENVGSGLLTFNGANATGVTGAFDVFTVTFDTLLAGTSVLDLEFSAMAATSFNSLIGILEIIDGSIIVEGTSSGVVELDGVVTSATGGASGNTDTSFEIASHTTGTGEDRLMLVGVSWNSGTDAKNITSVVFNYDTTELSFDEVITQEVTVSGSVSGPRYSAIYSYLNPPAGEIGTVTINFDEAVVNGIVAGVVNFKGVNQTDPLGTPAGANGEDTDPSVTLSGLGGTELIFDNVFLGGADNSYTLSVGTDQTEHWNDFSQNARGTSSTEQAVGSSVTMSWDAVTENWWAQTAVPINPAPGVPPTCYQLTLTSGTNGSAPTANPTQTSGCDSGYYAEGQLINLTAHP